LVSWAQASAVHRDVFLTAKPRPSCRMFFTRAGSYSGAERVRAQRRRSTKAQA